MDETNGRASGFEVIDEKGVRGALDLTVVPPEGSESRLVLVRFDDGSQVFASAASFVERDERTFGFPGSFADLLTQNRQSAYGAHAFGQSGEIVIPLLEEELKIARRKVLTGGVRVHKTVHERTETIDEPTMREQLEVQRVEINRFIDSAPAVRYEGDTMVVPLVEEVLVVEKKLVLREEIRILKRRDTVQNRRQIVVRREEATLERITPDADAISLADFTETDARESLDQTNVESEKIDAANQTGKANGE